MMTPHERYLRDAKFHALVHIFAREIEDCQYTATELREAVILAAQIVEQRRGYGRVTPDPRVTAPPNQTFVRGIEGPLPPSPDRERVVNPLREASRQAVESLAALRRVANSCAICDRHGCTTCHAPGDRCPCAGETA